MAAPHRAAPPGRPGALPRHDLRGGLRGICPVGATGVSLHITAAKHVTGTAPAMEQVDGAELAAVFNMGGSGVANYCSILEAVR